MIFYNLSSVALTASALPCTPDRQICCPLNVSSAFSLTSGMLYPALNPTHLSGASACAVSLGAVMERTISLQEGPRLSLLTLLRSTQRLEWTHSVRSPPASCPAGQLLPMGLSSCLCHQPPSRAGPCFFVSPAVLCSMGCFTN